jgi:uncharacterized protein involved in outer membrane biogenesis
MLPFLEELLEKKLSDLLGGVVTFDRVKLSPLSGKAEVLNLAASARGEAKPFLTVARIDAKIAMARALKQEIAIQSLRIERPVVRLPLPTLNKRHADRKEPAGTSKPWQFEADDVLIVDGTIAFQNEWYDALAENVTISLKRDAGGIVITLLADSLRRLDPDVSVGSLKATGQIATNDFAKIAESQISLNGELGSQLRVSAKTESLQSKTIDGKLEGTLDGAQLSRLVAQDKLQLPALQGLIHLWIEGTFSPSKINLRHAEFSTENAIVDFPS